MIPHISYQKSQEHQHHARPDTPRTTPTLSWNTPLLPHRNKTSLLPHRTDPRALQWRDVPRSVPLAVLPLLDQWRPVDVALQPRSHARVPAVDDGVRADEAEVLVQVFVVWTCGFVAEGAVAHEDDADFDAYFLVSFSFFFSFFFSFLRVGLVVDW
ncbi:hypothetical protein B0T22DRAFT_294232 [Podospora appendiculata]|uniref:Uncharacterized protein n=1 Tax=Podospora appendiculata TaxID=314037 RepID=A0AAE0X1L3_9PEZI|nr:hypothetical protein B0T22DRAFT_294232 [Podospora appendiculata]